MLALDIRRPFQREREKEKEWEFGFCIDNLNVLWKMDLGGSQGEGERERGGPAKAVVVGVEYWESLKGKKRKRSSSISHEKKN